MVELLVRRWWALAVRGLLAVLFGILTFIIPGLTLFSLVLLFGAYAILEGVFDVISAMHALALVLWIGAYADWLAARRSAYQNDNTLALPAQPLLQTQEGVRALDEAVSALRALSEPLPALHADPGLAAAAKALADDQARTGGTGHTGSDGSTLADRLARYGQLQGQAGENLAYGATTAVELIVGWVVDDGVAARGHRQNLLNPAFRLAGAAAAPHPQWGSVCVMDFAQQFEPKPGPVEPAATGAIST